MSTNIHFSDAACHYIKKKLQEKNAIGFRLSVKKTGCSGFSYAPTLVEEAKESDLSLEQEGITVFIDPTWLHLLNGLQVDYIEEEKSGLKQKRLVFTNPNEASRCGCGESFHIE